MKVINPQNLPLIDYRKIIPLQGKLKDLTRESYDNLLGSIKEHGFFVPAYIWFNDGKPYAMDVHQRLRVLNGEGIIFENTGREIPYLEIEAKDEHDARRKLLVITSQYGHITQEGFDQFVGEMQAFDDFDFDTSLANIQFDALPFLKEKKPTDDDAPKKEDKKDTKTGPTFSIELSSEEDCIQAKQVLKDFADRTNQDIQDVFINILEAGAEATLNDLGY